MSYHWVRVTRASDVTWEIHDHKVWRDLVAMIPDADLRKGMKEKHTQLIIESGLKNGKFQMMTTLDLGDSYRITFSPATPGKGKMPANSKSKIKSARRIGL